MYSQTNINRQIWIYFKNRKNNWHRR